MKVVVNNGITLPTSTGERRISEPSAVEYSIVDIQNDVHPFHKDHTGGFLGQ